MFKTKSILLLAIVLAGFYLPASAETEGSAPSASFPYAGPVNKDVCWNPLVKQSFNKGVANLLDLYFLNLKHSDLGQYGSVKDLVKSPRYLSSRRFGMTSLDADSGHAACSALISVSVKTRHHGNITIDGQVVDFQIEREEDGEMVVVRFPDMMGFVHALGGKVQDVTTDADMGNP
jgi:hypothetical protein